MVWRPRLLRTRWTLPPGRLETRQGADGLPLAVRVLLSCLETVYRQVAEDLDQFRFELAARSSDQVWVEKIKPQQVADSPEAVPDITGDAATELRATLAELRSDPKRSRHLAAGDAANSEKSPG